MKRLKSAFWSLAVFGLLVAGFTGAAASQTRNQREVRDLVRTLSAQVDEFQYALGYELRNNSAGSRSSSVGVDRSLNTLKDRISTFENNFAARRENGSDVREIVEAVNSVDSTLAGVSLNRKLQTDWDGVKKTISTLGANYGVVPRFAGRTSNTAVNYDFEPLPAPIRGGLTGTYTLDTSRSEKVANILNSSGVSQTNRVDLESKLDAPEQIALDVRGDRVILASSKGSPVTIVADGREKTETNNGRTVRLKATIRGEELTVSSLGGETDYTLIFASLEGGRSLKVTRRITTEYLDETIFAESFYTKTEEIAGLGIDPTDAIDAPTGDYSSNDPADMTIGNGNSTNLPSPSINGPGRTGEFIVPNGSTIVARLENLVDSKISQNNDRFKLTVESPMEFRGATIEGYISGVGRSGRISGSSNITFNFQSITLRDGKRYDFAGSLNSVKDPFGKTVKVDGEGVAKSDSQTRETVKRGGIGAGIGALIGAIAGGGKGAAIGAIIGGGAGAGSVLATGREDLKLEQGSSLTIEASSPIRGGGSVDSGISEN